MREELIIDDQVREFALEPGEAFELPEETLQEIYKELLLQEAKALKINPELPDAFVTEATVTPIAYSDEKIEEMRKYFND